MRTLDHWHSRLIAIPGAIQCRDMRLMTGDDTAPAMFVGPGHIVIKNSTSIEFTLFATAQNEGLALLQILRARENPYDIVDQFRLFATDYEGTEWACGWTHPIFTESSANAWLVTGPLTSLVTHASGSWVSTESGVELIFQPKFDLPMTKRMISTSMIDGIEIERKATPGKHVVDVVEF